MYIPSITSALLLTLALQNGVSAAAADDKSKSSKPCTIASSTGSFYDLNGISVQPPVEGKKPLKTDKIDSWHARGYDYNHNFTLNVCAPVVEDIEDVIGINKPHWGNVSAFYKAGSKTYSLGYAFLSWPFERCTDSSKQTTVIKFDPSRKTVGLTVHKWISMWEIP
jgi:cation-dependent mannose-6-phosphate receptor